MLYGVSNLMDRAVASANHLNKKVLMMYGRNDDIIPRDDDLFCSFTFSSSNSKCFSSIDLAFMRFSSAVMTVFSKKEERVLLVPSRAASSFLFCNENIRNEQNGKDTTRDAGRVTFSTFVGFAGSVSPFE